VCAAVPLQRLQPMRLANSVSLNQPDRSASHDFIPSATSFVGGAANYIEAACILCDAGRVVEPIGLLASHGLELALKAYLLHCKVTEKELRTIGHDLSELWMRARQKGLGIEGGPPYWVRVLGFAHGTPYHLYRYPPDRVASAIPEAQELKRALADFRAVVTAAVRRS
jgi:hypothetical protein